MFHFLTLAFQEILRQYNIVDKDSCRTFLRDLVLLVQTRASETGITFDEATLKHVMFTLNNDALFDYSYRLIADQLQTEEILFESADEETIAGFAEDAAANTPETIDPVLIVSLVTQIISIINTIKANRNR